LKYGKKYKPIPGQIIGSFHAFTGGYFFRNFENGKIVQIQPFKQDESVKNHPNNWMMINNNEGYNVIINHDFRYEHTLRIDFDVPVGIGSYEINTQKDLLDFYNEFADSSICSIELYQRCLKLEEEINNILTDSLKSCDNGHFELDWRDEFEIEIHGINRNKFKEDMIEEIDLKLNNLLKKGTNE